MKCSLKLLCLVAIICFITFASGQETEQGYSTTEVVEETSETHREEFIMDKDQTQAGGLKADPPKYTKIMKKYYELDFNIYNLIAVGSSILLSMFLVLAIKCCYDKEKIAKFDYLLVTGGSSQTQAGGLIFITYCTMVSVIGGALLFYWFRQYPREPHFWKNDPTLRNNFPLNFDLNLVISTSNKLSLTEAEQKDCKGLTPKVEVSPGLEYTKPSITCELKDSSENESEYRVKVSFKNEAKPYPLSGQTIIIETDNLAEEIKSLKWQMQMTNKFNANGLYGPNSPIRHQIPDEKENELKDGLAMKQGRAIAKIQMTPMNYDNHIEEIHYKTYKPELISLEYEDSGKNILEVEFDENEFRRYDFVQPHSSFGQTCSYLTFLLIIGMFLSGILKKRFTA